MLICHIVPIAGAEVKLDWEDAADAMPETKAEPAVDAGAAGGAFDPFGAADGQPSGDGEVGDDDFAWEDV